MNTNVQDWSRYQVFEDQDTLAAIVLDPIPLTENGLGALVAWVVGPEQCVACKEFAKPPRTRIEVERAGGDVHRWDEPRSEDDQESIEGDINDYIAEAGVPPRPPGLEWYFIGAETLGPDEFEQGITDAFRSAGDDPTPANLLVALSQHLRP